jgi:hypothetical protein
MVKTPSRQGSPGLSQKYEDPLPAILLISPVIPAILSVIPAKAGIQ